ncbi:MAG: Spy/CpxP family protein refolding chaperone [Clostridiales bacterium]|jgi:hypothetical protein|nr:Spy/CpxP family protein refolding chaperone [Clostridiales bacterium]
MKKIATIILFALVCSANPVLKFFNRTVTESEIACQSGSVSEISEPPIGENFQKFSSDGVDCAAENSFVHVDCAAENAAGQSDYNAKNTTARTETDGETFQICSAKPKKPFAGIYKNLKDYHIEFFERNIVKKPVVTKYSREELTKMAKDYGVDFYKMRVMLVVEAICEMNGTKKPLDQIKKMSFPELTKVVMDAKNKFFASLTPEEKAKFDAEYRNGKDKTTLRYAESAV